MPYIPEDRRHSICSLGADGGNPHPQTSGELNYWITEQIIGYMKYKGLNYATINDIVGALSCATQEFYRRVVVPYEDKKILENGDCY